MTGSDFIAAARRSTLLAWLAVGAWAGLIFFFSAQPSLDSGLGAWDLVLRKAAHMFVFGVLTLLVWRALRQQGMRPSTALALGAVLSLAYAISDEYHQSFVSGRSGTVYDVGFDLTGILIAAVVIGARGSAAAARRRQASIRK
ncbi:MAG: VanZ family protein [Thermoleophilia bacterium]